MTETLDVYDTFSERLLPGWFYNDPEWFLEQLREDKKLFLHYMWTKACEHVASTQEIRSGDVDVSFERTGKTQWAVVQCPLRGDERVDDTRFVAFSVKPQTVCTLRVRKDDVGNSRAVLGAWRSDGTCEELGNAAGFDLDAFIEHLSKR